MFYLWLDFETTGLDPYTDAILETGIAITDASLGTLMVDQWLSPPDYPWSDNCIDAVREMHEDSGLSFQLEPEWWLSHYKLSEVETHIIRRIFPYLTDGKITLAGSGVATFDKRFIEEAMPDLYRYLNYWTLDIGVVRRFLSDVCGVLLPELGPVRHRALADVEHHLLEARAYMDGIREHGWSIGNWMHA